MKLKKLPNTILIVITMLITFFIACIDNINSLGGFVIITILLLIVLFNTIILIKYGRND